MSRFLTLVPCVLAIMLVPAAAKEKVKPPPDYSSAEAKGKTAAKACQKAISGCKATLNCESVVFFNNDYFTKPPCDCGGNPVQCSTNCYCRPPLVSKRPEKCISGYKACQGGCIRATDECCSDGSWCSPGGHCTAGGCEPD